MKWILTPFLFLSFLGSLFAQAQFSDQSKPSGVNNIGFNRGVAVVDYNQDGWEDLYFSRLAGTNFLYQNNGDGTFSDVTQSAGLAYTGNSVTAVFGDLDNDGWPDLVLGNRDEASLVYHNNGDGTFTDITFAAGVQNLGKVQTVLLADVNNDGWLDLYFANFGTENALFINQGNGQFKNTTTISGATDNQMAMGAVFFDYDNDGDQDLYLTHDANQPNILYQNNGDGHFVDVSAAAGVNYAGQGMGVDAGDFNNDGFLDLYITNLYENTLYLNQGDGTFSNRSGPAGVTDFGMGWGTAALDYNNDGWLDLYVCNETYFTISGHQYPNVLYQNLGNGSFTVVSANSPLESPFGGYGTACADFDKDGQLDIAIANSGTSDGNQLLVNEENNENHWVMLQLEGNLSNRSAIGARVELRAGPLTLCDQVMAGTGFAAQNSLKLHFGLGDITQIDQLDIYWPSGQKETFEALAVDRYYHIVEQTSITATPPSLSLKPTYVKIFPNPVNHQLSFDVNLPSHVQPMTYRILDSQGRALAMKKADKQIAGPHQEHWMLPTNIPNGLYLLEVQTAHFKQVEKFLLQR
ncbi:MAG: FG-GAP-like repeat-containing protein [Saprospiraceae bacterium]